MSFPSLRGNRSNILTQALQLPVRKKLDRLYETVGRRCQGVLKVMQSPAVYNPALTDAVLQSCATRRPEIDEYNNPKRASARPRGRRSFHAPDPLHDRDILVLGILSLWRSSPGFTMKGLVDDEMDRVFAITSKIWDSNLDICVKVSTACCLAKMTELAFWSPPKDEAGQLAVACLKLALCVISSLFLCSSPSYELPIDRRHS